MNNGLKKLMDKKNCSPKKFWSETDFLVLIQSFVQKIFLSERKFCPEKTFVPKKFFVKEIGRGYLSD